MKRYILCYLAAYLLSLAVFVGLLAISIGNWLFSSEPLWFSVLCVIAISLPFPALGDILGRRPKARLVQKPVRGLLILLALMAALCFLSEAVSSLELLSWPGLVLGNAARVLLGGSSYWDGAFILIGNLMLPLLFHLGWHWGSTS